jgi:lysophospholipase L1-like esterase
MKRFAPLIVFLSFLAAPVLAADGPTPYPDPKDTSAWPGEGPIRVFKWMTDNRAYFWTQREKNQGAVVFCGDSLTGNWKGDALKQAFPTLKIANRGIGGDTSRGLLFRFKEDVIELNPKAIVILIGTNDLSAHGDPKAVESNITAMIEQARAHNANVPIVLCTLPPRDNPKAPTKPNALADTNARIKAMAEKTAMLALVDLHQALADAEGHVVPEYFNDDKLHISPAGYAKWAEALKPAFEKLGIQ